MTNIYINGDNNVVNVVTSGQPVYISPSPSARRTPQISLDWNVIGVLIVGWASRSWRIGSSVNGSRMGLLTGYRP